MNKKPCSHETLGANDSGSVRICRDCAVVHLHIQNMSLRFEPAQFLKLASLIAEASKKLAGESGEIARRQSKTVVVH